MGGEMEGETSAPSKRNATSSDLEAGPRMASSWLRGDGYNWRGQIQGDFACQEQRAHVELWTQERWRGTRSPGGSAGDSGGFSEALAFQIDACGDEGGAGVAGVITESSTKVPGRDAQGGHTIQ